MVAVMIIHAAMLALAGAAAVIDHRSGRIPNALTFPALLAAPLLWLIIADGSVALLAILSILVCGLPSYLLFRQKAIGGGDVKLFAALGGLGGITMGIELQMYSLIAAVGFVLVATAVRGQAKAVLVNVGRLASNPFLPTDRKRPLAATEMHSVRLGPAIFVGTAISIWQAYAVL